MMKLQVVLVVSAFFKLSECSLAPFITPCHDSHSACLKSSAQRALTVLAAGVPALGIMTMDPMRVDRVTTSQAGLDMDFRDTLVSGLRNCKVLNLKRQKNKTFLDLKCSVTMVGDYKLGGKLLIMPIEGSGKYGIKIRDIVVKILFEVGEKMVDGEKYWTVNSWKHSSEVQTGVIFQFKNLFNGNKELSDAIHQFANQNWRDIFQEVAPPIVKAIVDRIVGETVKLFDKVPLNQLVLE